MFSLLRKLALEMGSSVAGLCKVMILVGSIVEYLRLEDPEHLVDFVSPARKSRLAGELDSENPFKDGLVSLSRTMSFLVSGLGRNKPHAEGSQLMQVRLPPRFLSRIDVYAKLTKATRSRVLTRFFERGLFCYMHSQRVMMKALVEAMQTNEHESTTTSGHEPANGN